MHKHALQLQIQGGCVIRMACAQNSDGWWLEKWRSIIFSRWLRIILIVLGDWLCTIKLDRIEVKLMLWCDTKYTKQVYNMASLIIDGGKSLTVIYAWHVLGIYTYRCRSFGAAMQLDMCCLYIGLYPPLKNTAWLESRWKLSFHANNNAHPTRKTELVLMNCQCMKHKRDSSVLMVLSTTLFGQYTFPRLFYTAGAVRNRPLVQYAALEELQNLNKALSYPCVPFHTSLRLDGVRMGRFDRQELEFHQYPNPTSQNVFSSLPMHVAVRDLVAWRCKTNCNKQILRFGTPVPFLFEPEVR